MWSHEFMYKLWVEDPAPIIEAIRGYVATDYDYPPTSRPCADDLEAAKREVDGGRQRREPRQAEPCARALAEHEPADARPPLLRRSGHQRAPAPRGDRDRPQAGRGRSARRRRGRRLPALQRAALPDGRPAGVRRPGRRLGSPRRSRGGLRAPAAGLARHGHQVGHRVPLRRPVGLPGALLRRRAGDHRRDQGSGGLARASSRARRASSPRWRSSTRCRRATSSSAG